MSDPTLSTTLPPAAEAPRVMRCYVCDAGSWHKVTVDRGGGPQPIHSESTIQICTNCGNTVHEVFPESEDKVKEYYRKEYRPQPNLMNLITTTHKVNYVRVFLRDFLVGAQKLGRPLVVGDVGAATGYLLNFFRQLGHKVAGSELTVTYRRMSEHYYGIPLAEELEPKHQYDLIVLYHVLEHLVEPDKKLAKLVGMLADGGHMLIATPEWFADLDEASGTSIKSFDHWFHKNHINVFSATSIQNLFRKAGLTVVKEDHVQYGQTYLLKKTGTPAAEGQYPPAPGAEQWLTKEDWREVARTMLKHEYAIRLHVAGKFQEAVQVEPRFPEAWLAYIFGRCGKDLAKQSDLLAQAETHVGHNHRFILSKAQWCYQQGRLAEAVELYQRNLAIKPNEDAWILLGYALSQMGRFQEARAAMDNAWQMDPRKWPEAQAWILSMVPQMPTWDERGLAAAREQLRLAPGAQPGGPVSISMPIQTAPEQAPAAEGVSA